MFDGIDYAALGHLHGRQRMTERIRYSGSPIAYSFSEEHHTKGSWLIDLREGGIGAEFVEAPVPRRLARVAGRLDDLLTSAEHDRHEDHWLQITLTDPDRPAAAMERLRRRFPHALVLGFRPENERAASARTWSERVTGRPEIDIAGDFVAEVTGGPASPAERDLLREAFQSCRHKEAMA